MDKNDATLTNGMREFDEIFESFHEVIKKIHFSYEYEIEVKIASPAQKGILNLNSRHESKVVIKAEHAFGNFTQRINSSDKIWFKGIIKTSLSSRADEFVVQKPQEADSSKNRKHTRVELTAIGCLQCSDKNLTPMSVKSSVKIENRLKDLRRVFKYLLNVIFNPLLKFK